jgi:quinol monooxygenase YgiN
MITVIAKMPIKKGKIDEALKEFKELMSEVANEEGTVLYSLNVEKANPNTLVVVEQYNGKEDLNFHSSTPYFNEFFAKISGLLAGNPELAVMEEIART